MRLMMLFALATLAVIGVIAVLFIGNFRQSQRDSIVLPDAAQRKRMEDYWASLG